MKNLKIFWELNKQAQVRPAQFMASTHHHQPPAEAASWSGLHSKALFSFEKFLDFGTVAISFVCSKYYPIID